MFRLRLRGRVGVGDGTRTWRVTEGSRKEVLHVWRERGVWQLCPPGALLACALVAEFVTDAFGDSGLSPRRERRTTRCYPFLNVKGVPGLRNEVLPPFVTLYQSRQETRAPQTPENQEKNRVRGVHNCEDGHRVAGS